MRIELSRSEIEALLDAIYYRFSIHEESSYYGPVSDLPDLRSAKNKLNLKLETRKTKKCRR